MRMAALYFAAYALLRCWLEPKFGTDLTMPDEQPKTSPFYWLEAIAVIWLIRYFGLFHADREGVCREA